MIVRRIGNTGLASAVLVILLLFSLNLSPVAAQTENPNTETTTAAAQPAEDRPSVSLGVDFLSQYIWRGMALSRSSAVIQPSITVAYKGFSVNFWGNWDTSENAPFAVTPRTGSKWNETDFTVGYSRDLYNGERLKALTLNLGFIYYALDGVISPQGDSCEFYTGLSADVNWFKLAATYNREFMHYPGNWLTVGVNRVFDLPFLKSNLDIGNSYIFLFSDDAAAYPNPNNPEKAFSGPLVGQLYATWNIPVHKWVTVSPKVGFWYALGGDSTPLLNAFSWDTQHNHVYGGINVTVAF
ncbi:TorF family putative porin [Desulfobacca acetoxidans]|uniref:Uncharacterized protein n=1 Tax=Desulfobacca acetoxidans (strain ATCC 700848 / DSM 11109 / ASRB2) TaxID=880072 RepID=F2NGJ6_DESAR|nr:TorF family putative porin [Desulfobacca acetoxidans]AEB07903.1 hypothetical protein Desac_0004 [Desulfobacca acetoxidans DSM 11109]HAY23288.1 hypothetical protein [Desulfobacterales bacterium]